MSISVENAYEDFVDGKGTGIPSYEVCSALISTEDFNGLVVKAINKGIKKMAFQPFGGSAVVVYEPIYTGPYTQTLQYKLEDKRIIVCFDRN